MHFAIIIGIVIGVLVLIFLLNEIVMAIISYNPTSTGKLPVKEEDIKIFGIRDWWSSFYVISDEEYYICINGGLGLKKVLSKLEQIKVDPETVSHVFLTHGHPDHIGSLKFFQKAKIPLHSKEKLAWFKLNPSLSSQNISLFCNGANWKIGKIKIRAIVTPGHTRREYEFSCQQQIFIHR